MRGAGTYSYPDGDTYTNCNGCTEIDADSATAPQPGAAPLGTLYWRLRQRTADSFQAFVKHSGVYAHADAKMIGHFEKATWNC